MNVEDILRAHGVGVGGGTEVVSSATEPTTGLRDGLFWYNTADQKIKMYAGSSFRDLGGSQSIFTTLSNRVVTSGAVSSVALGVQYVKGQDILMVFQGGTKINEGTEYTVSEDGTQITKTSGTWASGVMFDFIVIANTTVPTTKDNLNLTTLTTKIIVPAGNTTNVVFNIPEYDSTIDLLEVYQEEVKIHRGTHWELATNKQSINLLGYTANAGDTFYFYVTKKIRDNLPIDMFSGSYLTSGSVAKDKLSTEIVDELSELSEHLADEEKHLKTGERANWNAKETPAGAQAKANTAETNAKNASIPKSEKGQPGGVPMLDENGNIVNADGTRIGALTKISEVDLSLTPANSVSISGLRNYKDIIILLSGIKHNHTSILNFIIRTRNENELITSYGYKISGSSLNSVANDATLTTASLVANAELKGAVELFALHNDMYRIETSLLPTVNTLNQGRFLVYDTNFDAIEFNVASTYQMITGKIELWGSLK